VTIDPFTGVLIGLVAWVAIGLIGGWFAGLFDRPRKGHHDVPAE
jgi:hypothetical protein